MTSKYNVGEFSITLVNGELFDITITNRLLCEEYNIILKKYDQIFQSHSIIKNSDVLYKIMCDALDGNDRVFMTYHPNKCVTDVTSDIDNKRDRFMDVMIKVDAIYVQDEIEINIPIVDKHITPQQVIERIDYRMGELMPNIDKKIDEQEKRNIKIMDDVSREISDTHEWVDDRIRHCKKGLVEMMNADMRESYEYYKTKFVEIDRTIALCRSNIDMLRDENKMIKGELIEHIQSQPIMSVVRKIYFNNGMMSSAATTGCREYRIIDPWLMYDSKQLNIIGGMKYYTQCGKERDEIYDFDTNKFTPLKI